MRAPFATAMPAPIPRRPQRRRASFSASGQFSGRSPRLGIGPPGPRRGLRRTLPSPGKHRWGRELCPGPAIWPLRPDRWPPFWRERCFPEGFVTQQKLIAVRHLRAGGRLIPVHFFRNDGGSVAGRFVLGAEDTPIVDGPTPEAVLAVLRDVIDGMLLARKVA